MRKIYMAIVIVVLLLTLAAVIPTDVSAEIGGSFNVVEVVAPDKAKISFNGLPVVVRLANVKARPEAKNMLEKLIGRKKVTITYADELGTDESDVPYVYMGVGSAMARKFVNVELIEHGLADYDRSKSHSKRYDKRFTSALSKAKKAKLGMWSGKIKPKTDTPAPTVTLVKPTTTTKPAAKGSIVSELNSTFYHLQTCPSANRLSKRSLIRYTSPEAAERAGKRPCSRCQRGRAREFNRKTSAPQTRRRQWPGKLIGLKSNKTFFYSPVSVHLKKAQLSDMIGFNTLKEAKASGRKPDPYSLRLTALPGYPVEKPEPGECIGRALPYYRPCRRAPADESGLCLECQRGE